VTARLEARPCLASIPLAIATALIVASELLPHGLRDPLQARAAVMVLALAMAALVARGQTRAARSELGLRHRQQERTDGELVRAEERLELAQGIARIGAWDVDLITGQTVWSHSMGQILGVSSPNRWSGAETTSSISGSCGPTAVCAGFSLADG